MLCQSCQKRTANVHFTQVVNNKKVEMYLCEQCANEKGHMNFDSPLSLGSFFSGLIGLGNTSYPLPQVQDIVCGKCGMSYEKFQKIGKFGCSECYNTFSDRLKPVLKRLHGSSVHTGKIPGRISKSIKTSEEIDKLKELLNKAVKNEEYEKAAELRDKIRSLEVGL